MSWHESGEFASSALELRQKQRLWKLTKLWQEVEEFKELRTIFKKKDKKILVLKAVIEVALEKNTEGPADVIKQIDLLHHSNNILLTEYLKLRPDRATVSKSSELIKKCTAAYKKGGEGLDELRKLNSEFRAFSLNIEELIPILDEINKNYNSIKFLLKKTSDSNSLERMWQETVDLRTFEKTRVNRMKDARKMLEEDLDNLIGPDELIEQIEALYNEYTNAWGDYENVCSEFVDKCTEAYMSKDMEAFRKAMKSFDKNLIERNDCLKAIKDASLAIEKLMHEILNQTLVPHYREFKSSGSFY